LLERQIVGIAYETVTDAQGGTPLLMPMSEVAGRLSIQAGARCLEMAGGGNGTLLSGVPGVLPAKVLILGGGAVGSNAARMAIGLGADVTLLDISHARLRHLEEVFGARLKTCYSDAHALEELIPATALVIGAIYLPGKRAAKRFRLSGRGYRPGRLRRNIAPHFALASDLHRGRRGALLRHQHARSLRAHFHTGAHPGDAALRTAPGESGLAPGIE
jgi:alanine dehydrogenase